VLGYHRVVDRFEQERKNSLQGSLVSRGMLERQLDAIGRRHRFVSVDELTESMTEQRVTARPMAAVTFDDGYRDVYENAFPMLIRKGIPAALFLVTDLIGTERVHLHDLVYLSALRALAAWPAPAVTLQSLLREAELPAERARDILAHTGTPLALTRAILTRLSQAEIQRVSALLQRETCVDDASLPKSRSMTWDMVKEMQRAGITIGSHTRTHALLTNESTDRVWEQVAVSRQQLERQLGVPVWHFAYPDGRFNRAAVQALSAAGYRYAYTTCRHRDAGRPLLTIPRHVLWEHSAVDASERFSARILQCQEHGFLTGSPGCTPESHA